MADITQLTVGQAQRLDGIMTTLRPHGLDPRGMGIHSTNLHVERKAGGIIFFWLDGERDMANGILDTAGHGPWWTRSAGRCRKGIPEGLDDRERKASCRRLTI